jgi:hypothetical protein
MDALEAMYAPRVEAVDDVEQLGASYLHPVFTEAPSCGYSAEFRATHEAALAPLVARGVEVLEEQRQAELTRVGGRLEVRAWKEEANAVRLSIYASLLSLAAQTGRGKAWAEAFFPRKNAAAADGGEEAETEAEPAGDAGTPGDG